LVARHVDGRGFPDTPWSLVREAALRGSVESAAALARLCESYWYPLYYFLRRTGHSREAASDLVQGFFVRFLEADSLPKVDAAEGRFRSYLLGALRHFVADQRDRSRAHKRGQHLLAPLELDVEDGEHRFRVEPSSESSPEQAYEKKWALALLARVLDRLRAEYDALRAPPPARASGAVRRRAGLRAPRPPRRRAPDLRAGTCPDGPLLPPRPDLPAARAGSGGAGPGLTEVPLRRRTEPTRSQEGRGDQP
jgi:RNA polymerase sigma factor (sigma-70 family)